jgi:hypothetical protein
MIVYGWAISNYQRTDIFGFPKLSKLILLG